MRISYIAPRGRSLLVGGTLTAALFAGIVGCNPGNALKIQQPDNLNAATINSAAALPGVAGRDVQRVPDRLQWRGR